METNIAVTFSRRRLVLGLATILAFLPVPASAGGKRSTEEPAAKKFLGSIYQRYLGKSSAGAAGIPLTNAEGVRSYFTWALASLILEDRAAATELGESPVLQGDPFIGQPEWDISDFSIDVKDTSAPKTVGTVTLMNFGKPERVVLELLRSGKEWRIADVEWDSGTLRGLYRRKAAYDGEAVR
jgi:hypothetical protein